MEDVPAPGAGAGEILVRVMAAGAAPWDALIRAGKRKVSLQPPLTLGSDFAGGGAVWQMLFEYAHVKRGEAVMIPGAAANVALDLEGALAAARCTPFDRKFATRVLGVVRIERVNPQFPIHNRPGAPDLACSKETGETNDAYTNPR